MQVNKTTAFHKLAPADHLLSGGSGGGSSSSASGPPPNITYCLAQNGAQYLVYSDSGRSFRIDLGGSPAAVQYSLTWYDAIDEQHVIKVSHGLQLQPRWIIPTAAVS